MPNTLPVSDFLPLAYQRVLIDVRSPGEFAQGHIPGAVNIPLFSNEERAVVGTIYKQKSKEAAMLEGLRMVGPKMAGFVETAIRIAPDKKLAVHCWRGGQRSGSMAWLFRQAGFEVSTLEGGYKSYRHFVLDSLEHMSLKIIIIGGRTGSGKTKVLRALRQMDEQIIDLEALAHHKGSAFGSIGELPQPTVEQFENDLYHACAKIDPDKRVWMENESRSIGRVFIPQGFWAIMKASPLLHIDLPLELRVQNLVQDYAQYDRSELIAAFQKIDKKLGGLQLKEALDALQENDFPKAATIALRYYDKTYQHCLDNNPSPDIRIQQFDHNEPEIIAQACLDMAQGGLHL